MTKDELIAKQQLELEELKEQVKNKNAGLRDIHLQLISIGGPLNDNMDRYTPKQLLRFQRILFIVEAVAG